MSSTTIIFINKEVLNNPDFVKWIVRLYYKKDGEYYENLLPYHPCTEEDYAEFAPVNVSSQSEFNKFKDKMFCLDEWPDNFKLGGSTAD